MISVAFVTRDRTFRPYSTITPMFSTENVISYKFSGFEAIGVDYYKVEPEHMTITIDTTGLDIYIIYGNENSTDKTWGVSAYFVQDGQSLFNGMIPLTSVSWDRHKHLLTFDVYDIVKSLIYLNQNKTYYQSSSNATQPKYMLTDLITRATSTLTNDYGIRLVSYNDASATYDGTLYTNQEVRLKPRFNFTYPGWTGFAHYFIPPSGEIDNYEHDQTDFNRKWFMGFGTWTYRARWDVGLSPATPMLMMFKIFQVAGMPKIMMYWWLITDENPLGDVGEGKTFFYASGTGTESQVRAYASNILPVFNELLSTYCIPDGVMPSNYDSPHGWTLSTQILPSDDILVPYSPMGYHYPVWITLNGTIPSFQNIRLLPNENLGINDTIGKILRLGNWAIVNQEQDTIKLIDKPRIREIEARIDPIEISGNVISAKSMGYVIDGKEEFDFNFLQYAENIENALKYYYTSLFEKYRFALDITIDGINNLIQHGTKICYQGKDYYVFGIYRDATTTTYKAYGVA